MLFGCLVRFGLFGGMMFRSSYFGLGSGMMGGGFRFMGVGLVLFGLLVLASVFLVYSDIRPRYYSRRDDALLIARERYARGEITLEEYEKLRRSLE